MWRILDWLFMMQQQILRICSWIWLSLLRSRQRVLRNRQAATKSKAKKKAQYTDLKEKKAELAAELEQMEAQHAAAQQRVQQLMLDNKALIATYKPKDDKPNWAECMVDKILRIPCTVIAVLVQGDVICSLHICNLHAPLR